MYKCSEIIVQFIVPASLPAVTIRQRRQSLPERDDEEKIPCPS
jgi:hypothetical protein